MKNDKLILLVIMLTISMPAFASSDSQYKPIAFALAAGLIYLVVRIFKKNDD
jgi:hypothetical protein